MLNRKGRIEPGNSAARQVPHNRLAIAIEGQEQIVLRQGRLADSLAGQVRRCHGRHFSAARPIPQLRHPILVRCSNHRPAMAEGDAEKFLGWLTQSCGTKILIQLPNEYRAVWASRKKPPAILAEQTELSRENGDDLVICHPPDAHCLVAFHRCKETSVRAERSEPSVEYAFFLGRQVEEHHSPRVHGDQISSRRKGRVPILECTINGDHFSCVQVPDAHGVVPFRGSDYASEYPDTVLLSLYLRIKREQTRCCENMIPIRAELDAAQAVLVTFQFGGQFS